MTIYIQSLALVAKTKPGETKKQEKQHIITKHNQMTLAENRKHNNRTQERRSWV